MKWLDSRIHKPNSNHYDKYVVVFYYSGSQFLGFASWVPKDGYSDGDWANTECTNGNPLDGEVLYWMRHPNLPDLKEEE